MGSSLLSLFWWVAISAGASGAIFGFVGILVCVLPFARPRLHWFYFIGLLLVLGDLLYGLATPNSPDSHVDTAGHLGGLLAGLLIGCMLAGTFRLPIAQRSARQYRRLVYATAVLFILFGILAFVRHDVVELKRGELLLDKNLPEAIIHLQRFVSHYPNEPDAHLFLGAAYARSQRFRQAADEWKRSLDIAPHNPKLQVSLAGLYVLLGRNDEAIPLFRQGIPELPPNSATYCAFSKALMTTGKLDEAEEMAQKAVSLDPKCSECQAQLQLVKDVRSTTAKMMADIEAKQSKAEKLKAASGRKK
ncbi:MAG: hypothetical protein DMG65_18180 [Candidatus Angelobacter sp. Gp1-AA117]|nr:MAG: hypothetical protein DMG65_18180 [Candidatus Angelobacter sp. Gp1-AA117]